MKAPIIILSIFFFSCSSQNSNQKINFPNGGYEFAKEINIKDSSFPFYPIRSMETIRDSTHDAFFTRKLLELFNEPNISLRPEKKPVLRIMYDDETRPVYFIRVDENQIIIKKGQRVDYMHNVEDSLSTTEQFLLGVLKRGAPISRRLKQAKLLEKRYLDSLIKLYPDLGKDEYYDYLMEKAFVPLDKPFTYSTDYVSISTSKFYEMVNKLNKAAYWTLPIELDCMNSPSDGYGFILECNSGTKYNIVKFWSCSDEPSTFKMVCKELIELALLSKEIRL